MPAETHRFFRANAELYEQARTSIDLARGYPSGRAETAFPPAADVLTDDEGRCYVAVDIETANAPEIAALLPSFLSLGAEEITRADYLTAMPEEIEL